MIGRKPLMLEEPGMENKDDLRAQLAQLMGAGPNAPRSGLMFDGIQNLSRTPMDSVGGMSRSGNPVTDAFLGAGGASPKEGMMDNMIGRADQAGAMSGSGGGGAHPMGLKPQIDSASSGPPVAPIGRTGSRGTMTELPFPMEAMGAGGSAPREAMGEVTGGASPREMMGSGGIADPGMSMGAPTPMMAQPGMTGGGSPKEPAPQAMLGALRQPMPQGNFAQAINNNANSASMGGANSIARPSGPPSARRQMLSQLLARGRRGNRY